MRQNTQPSPKQGCSTRNSASVSGDYTLLLLTPTQPVFTGEAVERKVSKGPQQHAIKI